MRSEPEHLLVLTIDTSTGICKEEYNGPGAIVWQACENRKVSSNGTKSISLAKLRQLAKQCADQRLATVYPGIVDAPAAKG